MKISKLQIENYRLLKQFQLELEEELSLVIGKNNTGKTSILSILEKFLSQSDKVKFHFNDFNNEFKTELKALIESPDHIAEDDFRPLGIRLNLIIEYDANDDLSNISKVMMDLDPNNTFIAIGFEYTIAHEEYLLLKKNYTEFAIKEKGKVAAAIAVGKTYRARILYDLLQHDHAKYFKLGRKSFAYDHTTKSIKYETNIDLIKEEIGIKEIINFKYISAKREVTNKERNNTLSAQTSRIYKSTEVTNEQTEVVEKFKDRLTETDDDLSSIYDTLFEEIIEKVKKFGGIKANDSYIEIKSTLQQRELLEGNTTVIYKHDNDHQLPEYYNGLGYMNLISMIFEIEILIHEFKREQDKKPSDINLLFIEEPEAHTHPQMQYVFIKNIKQLLGEGIRRKDGEKRKLQYIISTHSSCIVAESVFDDIKYLKKEGNNSVIAKNLKSLADEYTHDGQEQNLRFLKQYLTLNRSELFFADKAIFIEGDTERILMPAMMKKVDSEVADNPLLSQNISIVEIGNYANVFERFINFIGIKSLIITDLDSVKKNFIKNANGSIKTSSTGKQRKTDYSCVVSEGEKTSNPTLKFFFKGTAFDQLKILSFTDKRFKKGNNWIVDKGGFLQIVFQTEENGYQARSFEDAFFNIPENIQFIKANRSKFKGLKNVKHFYDSTKSPFDLAETCIDSKGTFAIDILMYSADNNFENWQIPSYIKEGLLWLKQD